MPQELTYTLAKCCSPETGDGIIGYFKEDGTIAVHRSNCASVPRLRRERLLDVTWQEIQAAEGETDQAEIDPAFAALDDTDYLILKHHQELGMDYSIVVSETLGAPLEETHKRHRKLREMGGLERVEQRIIQYRKNTVKGKWIKHRNHTYYKLTPKGERWIQHLEKRRQSQKHM